MPRLALDIQTWSDRGRTLIELAGEIDLYSAPALRDELDRLPRDLSRGLIVVMTEVKFLDSTGLGVLVAAAKRARAAGGAVSLVDASAQILTVMRITGLTRVFGTHANLDEAFAWLATGAAP